MNKKTLLLSGIVFMICLTGFASCHFRNRDFYQKETVSVENVNDYRHPLIAVSEDGKIKLFAKSGEEYKGVLLKKGRYMYSFDWTWRNGGFNLPAIYAHDFDSDGQEEVLCILDLDGGTGISVYQLHMLEFNDNKCEDAIYNSYLVDLGEAVTYQIDEENHRVYFSINNITTEINTDMLGETAAPERIVYNDQVCFSCENNKIMLDILPGFKFRDIPFPLYGDIHIRARVNYKNGEFYLSDVLLE